MFEDTADNMTGIVVYLNPKGTKTLERSPDKPKTPAKSPRPESNASMFSV